MDINKEHREDFIKFFNKNLGAASNNLIDDYKNNEFGIQFMDIRALLILMAYSDRNDISSFEYLNENLEIEDIWGGFDHLAKLWVLFMVSIELGYFDRSYIKDKLDIVRINYHLSPSQWEYALNFRKSGRQYARIDLTQQGYIAINRFRKANVKLPIVDDLPLTDDLSIHGLEDWANDIVTKVFNKIVI